MMAASAGSLALHDAGGAPLGPQTFAMALGPCLSVGMGEAATVAVLHSWGATRDGEMLALKADLSATQAGLPSAFDQAKATLLAIVVDFRTEAETMRQHGQYEAAQSVARLEHVVAEARQRFDAQEVRFAHDLGPRPSRRGWRRSSTPRPRRRGCRRRL